MVPPIHRGAHRSRIPMSLPLFHAVVCAVPTILRRMVPEEEKRESEDHSGPYITVRRMVIMMEGIAKGSDRDRIYGASFLVPYWWWQITPPPISNISTNRSRGSCSIASTPPLLVSSESTANLRIRIARGWSPLEHSMNVTVVALPSAVSSDRC